jgi:gentisate 1,2-dioxygenase
MLKRSSIIADSTDLQRYYRDLEGLATRALWTQPHAPAEPRSRAVPHVWHWRDVRPEVMRAAELVGTQQAERRVLVLANPGTPGLWATSTLSANIQVVMPGEIARSHRHTQAALRMVIESRGGYTAVNGKKLGMLPGDLVLTPSWTWHDHANDSDTPMVWLDGLDSGLIRMLEATFYESYPHETQAVGDEPSASPWRYPYLETRAALDEQAATGLVDSFDGVILEYTNPVTGGAVMPTIGCYLQLLRPGHHTRAHRHTSNTAYHVVEGEGVTIVGDTRLDWEDKDVFVVPTWMFHEHVNTGDRDAVLFSHTDAPIMRALGLWREEARS